MFKIQPPDTIKSCFSEQENCLQSGNRKHAELSGIGNVPDGPHVR